MKIFGILFFVLIVIVSFFLIENYVFYHGILEAIIELIVLTFISAILAAPFFALVVGIFKNARSNKVRMAILIFALSTFGLAEIIFLKNHLIMSYELREVKMDFKQTSRTGDWHFNKGSHRADYGGQLDSIIKWGRDAKLEEKGFVTLRGWTSGLGDPAGDDTVGIYIYVGK